MDAEPTPARDGAARRRRRRRATSAQGAPPPAPVPGPGPAPPASEAPKPKPPPADSRVPTGEPPRGKSPRRRRAPRESTERGLRDLVGPGPSQLGVSGALRGRDVNRPTDADLAEAERDLVIVRRHWQPSDRSGD